MENILYAFSIKILGGILLGCLSSHIAFSQEVFPQLVSRHKLTEEVKDLATQWYYYLSPSHALKDCAENPDNLSDDASKKQKSSFDKQLKNHLSQLGWKKKIETHFMNQHTAFEEQNSVHISPAVVLLDPSSSEDMNFLAAQDAYSIVNHHRLISLITQSITEISWVPAVPPLIQIIRGKQLGKKMYGALWVGFLGLLANKQFFNLPNYISNIQKNNARKYASARTGITYRTSLN